MIALDTNVLVRYLTRDDAGQAEAARSLVASLSPDSPGFVCREVLVELVWVLDRSHAASRDRIASALLGLLAADAIVVESADDVAAAVMAYADGVSDFSDLMILAAARRAAATPLYTSDRRASRVDGVELLGAEAP